VVIEKTNPIGIDAVVFCVQKALQKLKWADKLNIYPRCYPVIRDQLSTIEYYTERIDYQNLVFAEENKCFFLLTGDIEKINNLKYSTELELFFTLNLPEITGLPDRRDAEVHNDVLAALRSSSMISINRLVTDIADVFNGYSYRIEDDMQPYHCFKVLLNVSSFDPNNKCSC